METNTNLTLSSFMEMIKPIIQNINSDICEIKNDGKETKNDIKELRKEFTEHRIEEMTIFATKEEHKENKTSIQQQNDKITELEKNGVKLNYFHSAIVVVISAFISGFGLVILEKILNNK